MKTRTICLLLGILLIAGISISNAQDERISVLSPRGAPPPTPLVPMAPRLDSLDGKTLYLVDIKFEGGDSLLRATMQWFARNLKNTKFVFREKAGSYDQEDPKLWAEIEEKADAVIVAIGH